MDLVQEAGHATRRGRSRPGDPGCHGDHRCGRPVGRGTDEAGRGSRWYLVAVVWRGPRRPGSARSTICSSQHLPGAGAQVGRDVENQVNPTTGVGDRVGAAIVDDLDGLYCFACCSRATTSAAQDVVQETAACAPATADGFEGEASARMWLHRIVHNVVPMSRAGRAAWCRPRRSRRCGATMTTPSTPSSGPPLLRAVSTAVLGCPQDRSQQLLSKSARGSRDGNVSATTVASLALALAVLQGLPTVGPLGRAVVMGSAAPP
jgi:hypothetical protein